MAQTRRDFLRNAGLAGLGAAVLPAWWPEWIDPAFAGTSALTTLSQTIIRGTRTGFGTTGAVYHQLRFGHGEPHLLRTDLSRTRSTRRERTAERRSLLNFVHLTDVNITDGQSPARAEFLDRYDTADLGASFKGSYRPHEMLTVQVLEAMIRQVRALSISPISANPISFAIATGDNINNEQLNELRWFIDTMDGGKVVTPNSGGASYEGVMSPSWGDSEFWHPSKGGTDRYKLGYGFPEYPGLLEKATRPFKATGMGMPWFQTFGSHDGLMQGSVPRNPFFESVSTGRSKVKALPADVNPSDGFDKIAMYLRTLLGDRKAGNPGAFAGAQAVEVTADPNRRILTREDYIREMFATTGTPAGHGFTAANLPQADGSIATYWHSDAYARFRMIGLDTVNPGGDESGSIGDKQLKWLEQRLIEVSARYYDASGNLVTTSNKNRLVILF
ncbi:MAG: hypothetical protein QOK47_1188, partial [Actinomycetota bacterium]|nr:hypothetical protein [Actinomycetota bacterium]